MDHSEMDDVLEKLVRRELTPREIRESAVHVSECVECSVRLTSLAPAGELLGLLLTEGDHPDFDTDLIPYVDNEPAYGRREFVRKHLTVCPRCAEDVEDLVFERDQLQWQRRRRLIFGATAAAAAVVTVILLIPRSPDVNQRSVRVRSPSVRTLARPHDWEEAVREAVRRGKLDPPPIIRELNAQAGALRGPHETIDADLTPTARVIEENEPLLQWSRFEDAKYTVNISDSAHHIWSSPTLTTNSWKVSSPLQRGETYTWEVEIHKGSQSALIPSPPNPPATFRILDSAAEEELSLARRRFPGDHLLIGILAARAGLAEVAERELRQARSPEAQRLADSVRRW